ncbi:MAG: ACT domain-containing protein [Candidatus Competibacter sp.]|jgi:hypothetical protein
MSQSLSVLPHSFVIARLDAQAVVPAAIWSSQGFLSVSRTDEELSVVCSEDVAVTFDKVDRGWRALKIHGPLQFDQVGILASLADPLAAAGIGIFAVSTFDTDYILVKQATLSAALSALQGAGHEVVGSQIAQAASASRPRRRRL